MEALTWAPFGQGLPRVAVFDMAIQNVKRVLRIATHGRGMWEAALPGGVAPTPTPTPTVTATPTSTPTATPTATPPTALVVISQVFGGGGNTGAPFQNDFIEVFNRGNTSVDISSWSVQYASAAGTSWLVTPLCPSGPCTLVPGRTAWFREHRAAQWAQLCQRRM